VTYGLLALIGTSFGLSTVGAALAIGIALASMVWHLGRRMQFVGDRRGFQARRDLAVRPPLGLYYFGALLGFGFLTTMSTPLVYAGAAIAFASPISLGVLYGAGFALGRSIPAIVGVALPIGVRVAPQVVSPRTVSGFAAISMWLATATAVGLAAAAAIQLLI
jgi:hypothetical protein